MDIASLEYEVFHNSRSSHFNENPFYVKTYESWRNNWRQVFTEVGKDGPLFSDEFLRADLVASLKYEGQVVGLHLYSLFDLRNSACREHSYIQNKYSPKFFDALKERGLNRVMTMEYLTIEKSWRRQALRVPLAEMLVHLGVELFHSSSADTVITCVRNLKKVNSMCYRMGFEALDKDILIHGEESDLLIYDKRKRAPHAKLEVESQIRRLWNSTNFTPANERVQEALAA